jgi:hypothetical protein
MPGEVGIGLKISINGKGMQDRAAYIDPFAIIPPRKRELSREEKLVLARKLLNEVGLLEPLRVLLDNEKNIV